MLNGGSVPPNPRATAKHLPRCVTLLPRITPSGFLLGFVLLFPRPSALLAEVAEPALSENERACQHMLVGRKRIHEYIVRRADAMTDRAASEIRARAAWEAVRDRRREELREMFGLLAWPRRSPLQVKNSGAIDRGSCTIERIAFQSVPGFYVTANLPRRATARRRHIPARLK